MLSIRDEDFNCTIQELKQERKGLIDQVNRNFNCTIQELKRSAIVSEESLIWIFQLHHTGIKTDVIREADAVQYDFNCTIQELKCIHYTTPKN